MKKTIRIKFVGFWDGFDPNTNFLVKCLKEKYELVIVDENPEYIVCSVFGEPYQYCQYPQVRIMYSGENYIPDFNLIDYSICSYPIDYLDRNFRIPQCFASTIRGAWELLNKDRNYDSSILDTKEYFANFIASHESENNVRGDFFKKLSEYKRVESCGSYLNNMPNGKIIDRDSKTDLQKKTKFTLCFESTKHEGFITEKITDAFYADTIPVYYGSSDAKNIFNEKSFIDCSDYETFDDVINKIIELDNDNESYMEMLRQPIFVDNEYPNKLKADFEKFVYNIFDQPINLAYRRSRVYMPKHHNDYSLNMREKMGIDELSSRLMIKMIIKRMINNIYN